MRQVVRLCALAAGAAARITTQATTVQNAIACFDIDWLLYGAREGGPTTQRIQVHAANAPRAASFTLKSSKFHSNSTRRVCLFSHTSAHTECSRIGKVEGRGVGRSLP